MHDNKGITTVLMAKCKCMRYIDICIYRWFSNGVLGADEMFGSIEGRLLAYEIQIRLSYCRWSSPLTIFCGLSSRCNQHDSKS